MIHSVFIFFILTSIKIIPNNIDENDNKKKYVLQSNIKYIYIYEIIGQIIRPDWCKIVILSHYQVISFKKICKK